MNQIGSIEWGCILNVRPNARKENIVKVLWIDDWDLFIMFDDGVKYIYDIQTESSRSYTYNLNTITEEQWKFEFKEKLERRLAHMYISQEELADRVGTTQPMISKYINGDAMPGLYMFHKIVDAIGCDDRDLLFQDYEKM